MARITEVIWKRFKIKYHNDHVGRMLHGLGYTCQKPSKQPKVHDDKAERTSRKREWPRKMGCKIES
jgi:transposase